MENVDLLLHEEAFHSTLFNGPIIAPGNGDGSFGRVTSIASYHATDSSAGLTTGDVDGDGRSEVISSWNQRLNVYGRSDVTSFAAVATSFDFSEQIDNIGIHDVNGDRIPDLVAEARSGDELLVRLGELNGFGEERRLVMTHPLSFWLSAEGTRPTENPLVQRRVGDIFTTLEVSAASESGERATYHVPVRYSGNIDRAFAHLDVDHDGDLDFVQGHDGGFVVLWGIGQGDFDQNGKLDGLDLQLLRDQFGAIDGTATDFDLTGDGIVDDLDVEHFVREVGQTSAGDANFDRKVDFADYLTLARNFGEQNAVWTDGDFDGNGTVGFSDYVLLAQNFGFSFVLPVSEVLFSVAYEPFGKERGAALVGSVFESGQKIALRVRLSEAAYELEEVILGFRADRGCELSVPLVSVHADNGGPVQPGTLIAELTGPPLSSTWRDDRYSPETRLVLPERFWLLISDASANGCFNVWHRDPSAPVGIAKVGVREFRNDGELHVRDEVRTPFPRLEIRGHLALDG